MEKNSIMNLGNPLTVSNNFFSVREFMLEATPMNAQRVGNPSSRPLT